MKLSFFKNLTLGVAIVLTSSAAWAKPMKVELNSSTVIREVSMTGGSARLNLERGIVKVVVSHLPENPVTGEYEPVTLTDRTTRPATQKDAEGYQVWLLQVEDDGEGNLVIKKGYDLGILDVRKNGRGLLNYNGREDLSGHGFNMIAITADDHYDGEGWPSEFPLIDALRWGYSPTGVIVLWNSF